MESLLSVDDEVKRIVGLVGKYGDMRKTYFIFTSDNGLQLGAHRIEFKDYLYEEGERVPLIIRGPGVPVDTVRNQLSRTSTSLRPSPRSPGRCRAGPWTASPCCPSRRTPRSSANRDLLFESFDVGTFGVRRGEWAYNSGTTATRSSTTSTPTPTSSTTC